MDSPSILAVVPDVNGSRSDRSQPEQTLSRPAPPQQQQAATQRQQDYDVWITGFPPGSLRLHTLQYLLVPHYGKIVAHQIRSTSAMLKFEAPDAGDRLLRYI